MARASKVEFVDPVILTNAWELINAHASVEELRAFRPGIQDAIRQLAAGLQKRQLEYALCRLDREIGRQSQMKPALVCAS